MEHETIDHDAEVEEVLDRPLPAVPAAPSTALVAKGELTVAEVVQQMRVIEEAIREVMKEGVHYGTIPGTEKPTLYQPGAQKLNVLFRFAPSFRTDLTWHDDGGLTVKSTCLLTHIPTGLLVATGDGLCSTREKRYGKRKARRLCPMCGEPQINRSKYAPKSGDYTDASPSDPPGWYCWKSKGGCGVNFAASDPRIMEQTEGEIDNPDVADLYNTVLKMANKRALVAATINGTAAADQFTQDVEDLAPEDLPAASEAPRSAPPQPAYDGYVPPKTPSEMMDRLAFVFGGREHGMETAKAWLEEALIDRHEVTSMAELNQEQRNAFLVLVARVLRDLELEVAEHGDIAFRPDGVRELVADAFHRHLEAKLAGPMWRLDPSEESLDVWGTDDATNVAEPPADAEASEADAIPFGDDPDAFVDDPHA